MKSLRRVEKLLLILGTLLFVTNFYVLLFERDQLPSWLGIHISAKQLPVAQVGKLKNMGRRKLSGGNEFLPLAEQQTIFTHDSIMTGEDSEIRLDLGEGDSFVISPNTLIEISFLRAESGFSQREFRIKVYQGKVQQVSDIKRVTVVEAKANDVLLEQVSRPLAQTNHCQMIDLQVQAPNPSPQTLPALLGKLICPSAQKIKIQVSRENQIVGSEVEIDAAPAVPVIFHRKVNEPGTYQLASANFEQTISLDVPRRFEGFNPGAVSLDCKQTLQSRLAFTLPTQGAISYLDPNNEVLKLKPHSIPSPLQVKLLLVANSFEWVSSMVVVDIDRNCIVTTSPEKSARISKKKRQNILFSWGLRESDDYQLVIARDRELGKKIKELKTRRNFAQVDLSEPGTYYWQVRSAAGEYSDVNSFTLQ